MKACSECEHWKRLQIENRHDILGECHAMPPHGTLRGLLGLTLASAGKSSQGALLEQMRWKWPLAEADDFCWAFEPENYGACELKGASGMISIVVCVEYDDLLAVTLPRNVRHFEQTYVITTPRDEATRAVIGRVPSARPFFTEAFYAHGDHFNKGRAIDDALQLFADTHVWTGWCCHWDADILFPPHYRIPGWALGTDCLYTPVARRGCKNPAEYRGQTDWQQWPVISQGRDFDAGWCQIFHRLAPPLATRPFYPREWGHAGNSDTFFNDKWPCERQRLLPFEVLHLGEERANWHGRTTPKLDGTVPKEAERRRRWTNEMRQQRRQTGLNGERSSGEPA